MNLKDMTLRQLRDAAIAHVVLQGVPAGNIKAASAYDDEPTFTCLYRGPNGTSCAVGGLVDDETLAKADLGEQSTGGIEGKGSHVLLSYIGLEQAKVSVLGALQGAHDGAALNVTRGWRPGKDDRKVAVPDFVQDFLRLVRDSSLLNQL